MCDHAQSSWRYWSTVSILTMLEKIKIPKIVSLEFIGKILKIANTKEEFFLQIFPMCDLLRKKDFLYLYFNFDYFLFKVTSGNKTKQSQHIASMITLKKKIEQLFFGLSTGFSSQLILEGIGYRVTCDSSTLFFKLGFSHPVKIPIPRRIKVFCFKETQLLLKSSSKNRLRNFVLGIQHIKKPDVYKNKGILFKEKQSCKKKFKKK